MADVTDLLRRSVSSAGIEIFGVTSAEPILPLPMKLGHRQPRQIMPEARAVAIAGFSIRYEQPKLNDSVSRGRFTPYSRVFGPMASYCFRVISELLKSRDYRAMLGDYLAIKPAVVRSGIGTYGKHGVVVTPSLGSWVMFVCVITDAPLDASSLPQDQCDCPSGCQECIKACPTAAITGPFEVDRTRCITNWLWGYPAPRELRPLQGCRLFGCGECLAACPKNKKVPHVTSYPVDVDTTSDDPELIPLVTMNQEYFKRAAPTFAQEAGIEAIRGSATICLGNKKDADAVPALAEVLGGGHPQNRGYAAWALGRIGGKRARALLEAARTSESVEGVRAEIESALAVC